MCSTLFLMTQNTELRQECERCCIAGEGDAADDVTYVSGRIELRNIAHVMESWEVSSLTIFKRKYKSEPYFKHLSFVEKSSLLFPQVVLVGSDPQDVLTLQIAGWPPETIHDLFRKKIKVK
ncbi:hypothetical protein Q4I28_004994 [Leishmania naiffi]|uniref:Uncharacterized protein n=1 Tax=Leishmania naiffi TaxID=5678 RepID=A0AAW3BLH5_9TRYP